MTDYIEANNIVTSRNLRDCDTSDVIPRLKEVYEMALPYLNHDMDTVDFGCRDGYLLEILKSHGYKTMGVDCNVDAIARAVAKGHHVVQENIEDMSEMYQEGEIFDFIFSIHTLEHVMYAQKAVDEMHRLLKPEGFVLIEVPVEEKEVVDEPEKHGHYSPFTSADMVEDLFHNYKLIEHTWQQTKSRKPWHRWIYNAHKDVGKEETYEDK
jgi:SAM-dependent methyltransferase